MSTSHTCDICKKVFSTNTDLYNHKNKHKVLVLHNHIPAPSMNNDSEDEHMSDEEDIPLPRDSSDDEAVTPKRRREEYDSDASRGRTRAEERRRRVKSRDKSKYLNTIERLKKELIDKELELNKLRNALQKGLDKLASFNTRWDREMKKKDDECANKIKKIEDDCNQKIIDLEKAHDEYTRKLVDECKQKIADLEKAHDDLLRLQTASNEDTPELEELSNKIYNCDTIEDIMTVRDLIRNHRFSELNTTQLKTLQDLFVSMSHGIIPICQPQRLSMTSKQKDLAEKIQFSSQATVRRLLNENKGDIIALFTIIDDSLKLVRDSYNSRESRRKK